MTLEGILEWLSQNWITATFCAVLFVGDFIWKVATQRRLNRLEEQIRKLS